MNINEIIENKIKYEMGQLYNYLNEIENTYISPHITGENLVRFFNLNATNQYGQDFMHKKYYISGDIIEKYGLMYFDRQNQSKLTHPNFYGLSDRVIFPFRDHKSGIIAGLHCRLVSHKKEEKSKQKAKYLNIVDYGELKTKGNGYQYYGIKSFSIGQFLFNLFDIKNNKVTKLWITEGVADCMKLISLGYINAVSPGQSNLTDEQINLLKHYFGCEIEVLLFFDNDYNNIGQCNSIQIAYKLWNSGFRKIKIVRTFPGQGKDLTDVAVAIQDDNQLQMLIDLWEKNAYAFSPASEEHLNILLNSGYYTDAEVFSIDPRDIEEEIAKFNLLKKLSQQNGIDIKELKQIKNITSILELKTNNSNDNTKDNVFEPAGTTHITPPSRNEVELCKTDTSQKTEYYFMNISDAQLYRLKQKFDIDTIKEIDEKCTREQIINIVGKIINGIPFELDEYFSPEKFTPPTLVDEDFKPILVEPEDMPF